MNAHSEGRRCKARCNTKERVGGPWGATSLLVSMEAAEPGGHVCACTSTPCTGARTKDPRTRGVCLGERGGATLLLLFRHAVGLRGTTCVRVRGSISLWIQAWIERSRKRTSTQGPWAPVASSQRGFWGSTDSSSHVRTRQVDVFIPKNDTFRTHSPTIRRPIMSGRWRTCG